jgi:dienelactone hydrolase
MAMKSAATFDYDPIAQLDAASSAAKKRFAFTARTPQEARAWQRRARTALAKCLGFLDEKNVPPQAMEIERVDRGSYVRHKIVIRTMPHAQLPLYLLVPKGIAKPRAAVLALHGHGYGVKDIVGLWEDGSERFTPDGYHKDFGCALAERGFVVAAPEISCFGERLMRNSAAFGASCLSGTCHNVATYAMMLGKSAAGLRVLDALRVVDYLSTRQEIDADAIGIMGISGGGMHAFFSAAIDPRIKAAVISGYFCDWRDSILSLFHCTCNFVPGLLNLGELSDLAALLAPRPLLVEHGTRDPIFPVARVKAAVAKARRAWNMFGRNDKFATDYFEGRHRINGDAAYEFLAAHLGLREQ